MPLVAHLALRLDTADLSVSYAAVAATLEETMATEGCLGAEVLTDLADPSLLVIVETWASEEHDAAYRAWRRGAGAPTKLLAVLAGPPTLRRFSTTT